jgi:hypothetical protein
VNYRAKFNLACEVGICRTPPMRFLFEAALAEVEILHRSEVIDDSILD